MMKEALFYSFLIIFVATAIVTLLGLTGHLRIKPGFLKALVTSLILELAVSVIALYKATDFFDGAKFERYVKPNQQEYIWKEAKIRFSFPRTGWSLDTKRMQGGLGDLALIAGNDVSAQIQLHNSALDSKYVDKWDLFLQKTKDQWQITLSPFGPVSTEDIYVDGFKGFRLKGRMPGSEGKPKLVDVVYVPVSNEFFIEVHYTRNEGAKIPFHDETYEIVLSTLLIEK